MTELTISGANELSELKHEQDALNVQIKRAMEAGFRHEASALERKYWNIEERMNDIKKLGIATRERSGLIREIKRGKFFTVKYERDLGSRDKIVVGYSNALKRYAKVKVMTYTNFMRNVQGMGSLAGKTEILNIEYIAKQVYDEIVKGVQGAGGAQHTTHFAGASQTERH